MRKRHDARKIKQAASGRWGQVLRELAPDLELALRKAPRHVPCPIHGGKDGFRLFNDYEDTGGGVCNTCGAFNDGFQLLQWVNGWNFPQTCEAIAGVLGIDKDAVISQPNKPHAPDPGLGAEEKQENERKRAMLKRVWREALPIDARKSEPARLYLARRGLHWRDIDPMIMRLHPALPYYRERKIVGKFPTIISLVSDKEGAPVTLHRIYLTEEGYKAPVDSPKKMMAYPSDRDISGGAIRLSPIQGETILGVAEGIETALAVQQATGMPVWSCISDTLLAAFEPPEDIDVVVAWADKDRERKGKRAGEDAATKLVERLSDEDYQALGLVPPQPIPPHAKGIDWLDVRNHYGDEALPDMRRIRKILIANQQKGKKKWKILSWIM